MTDLATLVVRLEAETSKYQTQLAQATKQLQQFQSSVTDAVGDIAAKFAAAFTVDKIVEFVQTAVESASQLSKLSQELGISVEQLGAFSAVAAQAGVGQDAMTTSLKKLNQAISEAAGDPTSKAAAAFKSLGIAVTDANGNIKSAAQILPEIANAYSQLADGPNKVAVQVQLLGKASLALIPTLNQGADALGVLEKAAVDAGSVMTGELAEAADELEKKFIALKQSFTGTLSKDVLTALLPTLNAFADGLKAVGQAGDSTGVIMGALAGAVKVLAVAILSAETTLKVFGAAFDAIGGSILATAQGKFAQAGQILKKYNDDAANIVNAGSQAIINVIEAGGTKQVAATRETATAAAEAYLKAFDDVFGKSQGISPALLQQQDQALKKVQEFSDSIKAQAQSFGQGSEAALNYKLSTGAIGEAVALAQKNLATATAQGISPFTQALYDSAKATLAAVAAARQYAAVLQQKQDTKDINDYTNHLQEQVLKLGQSEVAATDYAAATGKLGDALTRAGVQGDAARAHIHDLAVELASDKDKTALFSIDQQIETLAEHLGDAEASAFKFQNALLIRNIGATGGATTDAQLDSLRKLSVSQQEYNDLQQQASKAAQAEALAEVAVNESVRAGQTSTIAGQQQINDLRAAEAAQVKDIYPKIAAFQLQQVDNLGRLKEAQAQYNELAIQFGRIQQDEAQQEQAINDAVKNGQETELDGLAKIAQARSDEATSLGVVYDKMKAISDANSKDLPQLVDRTNQANAAIKTLAASTNDLANKLRTDFISAFSDSFTAFITGTESASQAWKSFVGSILSELIKLQTQKLLESLLSVSAGGGGGFFGALAGAISGGGKASGGPVQAGTSYTVGEHGAEEFVPDTNGTIVPNGKSGGMQHIVQNFTIQAPAGTVSRQTQTQVAATAASGISRASRRNN